MFKKAPNIKDEDVEKPSQRVGPFLNLEKSVNLLKINNHFKHKQSVCLVFFLFVRS